MLTNFRTFDYATPTPQSATNPIIRKPALLCYSTALALRAEADSFFTNRPFLWFLLLIPFCTLWIPFTVTFVKMDLHDIQAYMVSYMNEITSTFQKVPGSAMLIRYIQSSYQDDPVRSVIELVLVIFFIRYLLAPSYVTHNNNFVQLTEEVSDYSPKY